MHAATRVLITARPITSPSPGASMEACSLVQCKMRLVKKGRALD